MPQYLIDRTFFGSPRINPGMAGFLTSDRHLPAPSQASRTAFAIPLRTQWLFTHRLPFHSDRIAQDSHLIPYYPPQTDTFVLLPGGTVPIMFYFLLANQWYHNVMRITSLRAKAGDVIVTSRSQ